MTDYPFYEQEGPFKIIRGDFSFFMAIPNYKEIDEIQKKLHQDFQAKLYDLCKDYGYGVTSIQTSLTVIKND